MSNNLKVNSKTQLLEFKRKHNELVEEVPNENDIKQIIHADRNIISQINARLENNDFHMTFPAFILPIHMYDYDNGTDYFISYKENVAIDGNGSTVGDLYYDTTTNKVDVALYNEVSMENMSIEYIYSSGKTDDMRSFGDWYNILNSINVENATSGVVSEVLGLKTNGDLCKETAQSVVETVLENTQSGTPTSVIGLDANSHVVKGAISSGNSLHVYHFKGTPSEFSKEIFGVYVTTFDFETADDLIISMESDGYSSLRLHPISGVGIRTGETGISVAVGCYPQASNHRLVCKLSDATGANLFERFINKNSLTIAKIV